MAEDRIEPLSASEFDSEIMFAVGPIDFAEEVARNGRETYGADAVVTWATLRDAIARVAMVIEESVDD